MRKKIRSLALSAAMILGLSTGSMVMANSVPSEKAVVYTAPLQFEAGGALYTLPKDQSGFIYKNHTYVPFRFAAYTLGLQVHWNQETSTVQVLEPNEAMQRVIEEAREAYKIEMEDALTDEVKRETIRVYFRDVNYVMFGEEKEPPAELRSFIYKNTLYVPLRFFAESLGIDVYWNQTEYKISFPSLGQPETEEAVQEAPHESEPEPSEQDEAVEPAPAPAPAPGPAGPAGPSSPAPSKPSYESITGEAEASLLRLKASCENRLIAIYNDWVNAETDEEQAQHFAKGMAVYEDCTSQFESILKETESKLTQNGYSTDVIQEYRNVFEQTIADALSRIR